MGKTVPSFRIVLESEIEEWKRFRRGLQSQKDRECLDALMDMCRNNATASGAACNPIVFEPMVMSILLAQQRKLRELEYLLNDVLWQQISAQTQPRTLHK